MCEHIDSCSIYFGLRMQAHERVLVILQPANTPALQSPSSQLQSFLCICDFAVTSA